MRLGAPQDATDIVVVTALVDGELLCLIDDDGAIEIFAPYDPEVQEMVEAAREAFGPSARAITILEFRKLEGAVQEKGKAA